jgi:hypothetical protein
VVRRGGRPDRQLDGRWHGVGYGDRSIERSLLNISHTPRSGHQRNTCERDSYGNTNNPYLATAGGGQITIAAQENTGTTTDLDFTGGITDQNFWFLQSGNDLKIDILGTNTSVTVAGWFSSNDNQLQEISAGGLKIDSQVSQLVQAMATYSANNPGFDPASPSSSTVPNDTNLQNAIGAAWHA